VVEVVAEEGDAVLAHPLVFGRASNPNRGSSALDGPTPFSMTEPMRAE
jgi:hypothetical protein